MIFIAICDKNKADVADYHIKRLTMPRWELVGANAD